MRENRNTHIQYMPYILYILINEHVACHHIMGTWCFSAVTTYTLHARKIIIRSTYARGEFDHALHIQLYNVLFLCIYNYIISMKTAHYRERPADHKMEKLVKIIVSIQKTSKVHYRLVASMQQQQQPSALQ